MGPEVEHCGLIHFSANQRSPHQSKICLSLLAQLAKGTPLNPWGEGRGDLRFPSHDSISSAPQGCKSSNTLETVLPFPVHAEEVTDLRPLAKSSAPCPSRMRAKAEQDNSKQHGDNLCTWDFFRLQ